MHLGHRSFCCLLKTSYSIRLAIKSKFGIFSMAHVVKPAKWVRKSTSESSSSDFLFQGKCYGSILS